MGKTDDISVIFCLVPRRSGSNVNACRRSVSLLLKTLARAPGQLSSGGSAPKSFWPSRSLGITFFGDRAFRSLLLLFTLSLSFVRLFYVYLDRSASNTTAFHSSHSHQDKEDYCWGANHCYRKGFPCTDRRKVNEKYIFKPENIHHCEAYEW